MHSKSVIFAVNAVLLVPFIYYATSIPDACAVPQKWLEATDCYGDMGTGKTCCWTEDSGANKGKKVCQTCINFTDKEGWSYTKCGPVAPEASKSTLPGLQTQDRLPGGGVFEIPDSNDTLAENNSSGQ